MALAQRVHQRRALGALHGQLDWTGTAAWPGLATSSASLAVPQPRAAGSGARQYLIGDLSPKDCE
ncbi:hypothetical protein VR46_42565, partial [Streptomyces sp. NRRL S-444]